MTDLAQDVQQGQVASTQPVLDSSPQVSAENKQERTFTQSELNDIVGRNKREAVESYKRKLDSQVSQTPQVTQTSSQVPQNQNAYDGQDLRRIVAEEAQRLLDERTAVTQRNALEQDAQRIVNEFVTKLEAGKTKYPDFDKEMQGLDFRNIPHIVQLANMFDNTAELMYEMRKNPEKIGSLYQLIHVAPQLAYERMQQLSQSIKDNETASKTRLPNEPLSQLRPSQNGTGTGNEMTVSQARRKYRV